MTVVLDTNVLLVCVSDKSPFYWLFQAFTQKRFHLLLSTPILLEYEEVIGQHMGAKTSERIVSLLLQA